MHSSLPYLSWRLTHLPFKTHQFGGKRKASHHVLDYVTRCWKWRALCRHGDEAGRVSWRTIGPNRELALNLIPDQPTQKHNSALSVAVDRDRQMRMSEPWKSNGGETATAWCKNFAPGVVPWGAGTSCYASEIGDRPQVKLSLPQLEDSKFMPTPLVQTEMNGLCPLNISHTQGAELHAEDVPSWWWWHQAGWLWLEQAMEGQVRAECYFSGGGCAIF